MQNFPSNAVAATQPPLSRRKAAFVPPQSWTEATMGEIWRALLNAPQVGMDDDFFELGGTLELAEKMLAELQNKTGKKLPLRTALERATVRSIAAALDAQGGRVRRWPVITVQTAGAKTPFFFLHGDLEIGGLYCAHLARQIGADRPFFAVEPHGGEAEPLPATIEEMAADRIEALRAVQPRGPYLLGGYCNGGLVVFEMARQLTAAGERVEALILVSTDGSNAYYQWLQKNTARIGRLFRLGENAQRRLFLRWRQRVTAYYQARHKLAEMSRRLPFWKKIWLVPKNTIVLAGRIFSGVTDGAPPKLSKMDAAYAVIMNGYIPRYYDGRVDVIWAREDWLVDREDSSAGWKFVTRETQVHAVPGHHLACLQGENLRVVATIIRECLDKVEQL